MKKIAILSAADVDALVPLLEEVQTVTDRTLVQDLYLHYRGDKGWCAGFGGSVAAYNPLEGPWTGLPKALLTALKPIRAQLKQNEQRARQERKAPKRLRRTSRQ